MPANSKQIKSRQLCSNSEYAAGFPLTSSKPYLRGRASGMSIEHREKYKVLQEMPFSAPTCVAAPCGMDFTVGNMGTQATLCHSGMKRMSSVMMMPGWREAARTLSPEAARRRASSLAC